MIDIPVTCTCGTPLSEIYETFLFLRAKKYKNHLSKLGIEITPEYLDISTDVGEVQLDDILEMLNLHRSCCRSKIMTTVRLIEYLPIPLSQEIKEK
jgi:DNA-directed RNA polymerase subunit N (RpoN/RPB10)